MKFELRKKERVDDDRVNISGEEQSIFHFTVSSDEKSDLKRETRRRVSRVKREK